MDSFDVKLEKRKAILRYRQLRRIADLLRIIEISVILVLISKFTTQFPSAVKSSGVYFRDLSVTLVSPRFVFILGNMIVITLFAKSGKFTSQSPAFNNSVIDLYEEFIEKSERGQAIQQDGVEHRVKQRKQRKQRISKEGKDYVSSETRIIKRSQLDNFKEVKSIKTCKELERSVTEKCIKRTDSREGISKSCYPEDRMSNEEFRDAIEAFIARQKKFRWEESALLLRNLGP